MGVEVPFDLMGVLYHQVSWFRCRRITLFFFDLINLVNFYILMFVATTFSS